MNMADVETFYDNLLSEKGLADAKTENEKNQWIRQNSTESIPKFIQDARDAGMKALNIIDESEKQGLISRQSADEWRSRLKKGNDWKEREKFIEQKLPEYQKNWKKLNEELVSLRKKQKALGVTEKDIPALKAINAESFKNKKFSEKKQLLDQAIAAFIAYEKDHKNGSPEKKMKQLYEKAEKNLQAAVQKGVLSPRKVGTWLRRIFEENNEPAQIENFLNGKGHNPLSSLVEEWTKARQHFDAIENKRKAVGTPMSFHFVHANVFLDWHFDKRMAYVEEANHRFEDIQKEKYQFLLIRNALDMKDWDEAEELMAEAKGADMTVEDAAKLSSMERFLLTHRPKNTDAKEEQEKEPTDEQVVERTRELLTHIPLSQQRSHIMALKEGASVFRVKRILWYNRVWCHQHRYLDENREKKLFNQAQLLTPKRLKHGHEEGHVANDVTNPTNVKHAIRDQEGINASQVLMTNEHSADPLHIQMKEQKDNRNFWYWTSEVPVDVPYEKHKHIVDNIHPELQKLSREMDKRHIAFTLSGAVEKKNQPMIAAEKKNEEAAHPALAA